MKVVFVASEAVPFAKTGGLADVAGSLPQAIERLGHTPYLFLPAFRRVWTSGREFKPTGISLQIPIGAKTVEGTVQQSRLPNSDVRVFLIDQPGYFDRDGLYGDAGSDYPDNSERFIFFDRAVLETLVRLDIRPDVIHCNDWQTGLIPVYLQTMYHSHAGLARTGTLYTVHNLAYQGLFPHEVMGQTGLQPWLFNWQDLEFYGKLSFMKAGLVFANLLSTVSPTYAREIQSEKFGYGLDGLLRRRHGDLRGIVNGIDPKVWTPSHESMLARQYDSSTVNIGKPACKAWLQEKAGLPVRPEVPIFAQVGRLDSQKGWELLAQVADRLLEQDVQLVVLGTGHLHYHELLETLARKYPTKVWAYLGFSEDLAHQIVAGADLFLMPSLFEPCGLTQLYSLAHGTLPIARATGGLADTVVDASPENQADGTANGFMFKDETPDALWLAILRALELWNDPDAWNRLVQTGMRADWSWDRSAVDYIRIYSEVIARVRGSD